MNIINAENLTKSYTERKLLDKASFYLPGGRKSRGNRYQRDGKVHPVKNHCGAGGTG